MNACFLIGSGLSQPAGYPSTDDLTRLIMSGEGITKDLTQRYYFGEEFEAQQLNARRQVERNLKVLQAISNECERYYELAGRKVNYEDIAGVAFQLRDALSGEYDNPSLYPMIVKMRTELSSLFFAERDQEKLTERFDLASRVVLDSELHAIFIEVCNYVIDIVGLKLLRSTVSSFEYLSFIRKMIEDPDFIEICICSLNGDLLLEELFRRNRISFAQGFLRDSEGTFYFDDNDFGRGEKVTFLKSHGSSDWFYNHNRKRIEISSSHANPINPHPQLLIGTHNKILEYARGIFARLFYEFVKRLRETDVLIICGYGFHDKGINSSIIDWMGGVHRKTRLFLFTVSRRQLRKQVVQRYSILAIGMSGCVMEDFDSLENIYPSKSL
jgi:hypothetical protein